MTSRLLAANSAPVVINYRSFQHQIDRVKLIYWRSAVWRRYNSHRGPHPPESTATTPPVHRMPNLLADKELIDWSSDRAAARTTILYPCNLNHVPAPRRRRLITDITPRRSRRTGLGFARSIRRRTSHSIPSYRYRRLVSIEASRSAGETTTVSTKRVFDVVTKIRRRNGSDLGRLTSLLSRRCTARDRDLTPKRC